MNPAGGNVAVEFNEQKSSSSDPKVEKSDVFDPEMIREWHMERWKVFRRYVIVLVVNVFKRRNVSARIMARHFYIENIWVPSLLFPTNFF